MKLERRMYSWSDTLKLQLTVNFMGMKVELSMRGLELGPDCHIEEREVEELVEHQPEVEEHYAPVTKRVAVCTDPVSGERTETVLD